MLSQKVRTTAELVVSAIALIAIELFCFLPIMRKIGFYLDDWATLEYMFFGPKDHGLAGLMQYYCLNDSLVVIRPLEALHFGLAYWNFGINPLPWHLVNVVLEVMAAWLVFVIVRRLSASNAVAFVSSVFVTLCPSHDSSHYWMVCSSVTLSLVFYLGSLWATLRGVAAKFKNCHLFWLWYVLSALFFACSLFNYEMFMPLAALNVLLAMLYSKKALVQKSWLLMALPTLFSMVLPIVSLLLYLKVIVPRISNSSMRSINFDISVFISTIWQGVVLNSPLSFGQFVWVRLLEGLDGIERGEIVRLAALALTAFLVTFWLQRKSDTEASASDFMALGAGPLIGLGLITVVVSYTIFGLCPDYPPTFVTLFNRINTGASIGLALVLAGILLVVEQKKTLQLLLPITACFVALVFCLANFGLAKPWIASWNTQKHVQGKLLSEVKALPKGSSVLLLNCPRYVMWAPVFDGVWDFRNCARILLQDRSFNANVVSERLSVDKVGVKDISRGTECGAYPFRSLYLLAAPSCTPLRAENAKEFIHFVERDGMGFGLQQEALDKWRQQAAKFD